MRCGNCQRPFLGDEEGGPSDRHSSEQNELISVARVSADAAPRANYALGIVPLTSFAFLLHFASPPLRTR
jgi:hypothetical protein